MSDMQSSVVLLLTNLDLSILGASDQSNIWMDTPFEAAQDYSIHIHKRAAI